jgi:hypothetical protein
VFVDKEIPCHDGGSFSWPRLLGGPVLQHRLVAHRSRTLSHTSAAGEHSTLHPVIGCDESGSRLYRIVDLIRVYRSLTEGTTPVTNYPNINQPAAGWYSDPRGTGGLAYWTGTQWGEAPKSKRNGPTSLALTSCPPPMRLWCRVPVAFSCSAVPEPILTLINHSFIGGEHLDEAQAITAPGGSTSAALSSAPTARRSPATTSGLVRDDAISSMSPSQRRADNAGGGQSLVGHVLTGCEGALPREGPQLSHGWGPSSAGRAVAIRAA